MLTNIKPPSFLLLFIGLVKKYLVFMFIAGIFLTGCGQVELNKAQNNNVNAPKVEKASLTEQKSTGSETIIDKVLVSDVFDKQGSVEVNKTVFTPTTEQIAVSAYILGAEPGLKVLAKLQFLPTKETVGPVTNAVEIAGDIISNFLFTKPVTNWPSGNYEVVVYFNDGQNKVVNFNISE